MNDLNKAIIDSAKNLSHGSDDNYEFDEVSLLEFAKGLMLDAIHDNSLQVELFKVEE